MLAKRHIVVIGRILALLLFVANSGFTLALHACSMGKMACCVDAMPDTKTPALPASHSQAALAASQMQCCTVIVAGGANSAPIAQAQSSAQQPQKSKVGAELPAIAAHPGLQAPTLSKPSLISTRNAIAPPSVEKYVLHVVFLI